MTVFFGRAGVALCLSLCVLVVAREASAGVVLARTRVVFPADAEDVTVRLTNTRNTPVLVEAWIERDEDDPNTDDPVPFDIVPPIFRMEPGRGQALRLHRAPGAFARDRESLFWLNVFESPPIPEDATSNAMHIAVRTRIKLFVRPPGLSGSAAKAPDKLAWRLVGGETPSLRIGNPTPFHVTVARVVLGGGTLDLRGDMIPPFGHVLLPLDAPAPDGSTPQPDKRVDELQAGRFEFRFLNDSGGAEPRMATLSPAVGP